MWLRKRAWLFLCLFSSTIVLAEEARNYQIELVVFENLDLSNRQSEIWPTQLNFTLPSNMVELGSGNDLKFGFRPVAGTKLTQEIKNLEASNNYRILLHSSWRQPGLDAQAALPVHLSATIVVPSNDPAIPGSPVVETQKVLDGYIKIILAKYLHADVDLIYHDVSNTPSPTPLPPVLPAASPSLKLSETNLPPIFELKQSRKMRSKELHYLDSPVLGMLIYIIPLQ
ncbi:MAG: hypothetical protein HY080_06580 [Gammaproteobacteria bacterium]|nr:hypothetical protein [Gammaproteobacteria bacterium]